MGVPAGFLALLGWSPQGCGRATACISTSGLAESEWMHF